jgi:phospholipase C
VLFSAFLAEVAIAQIPQGTFKHIIIVVQENRTPDNLFGAAPASAAKCGQEQQPIITGADIDNGGLRHTIRPNAVPTHLQHPSVDHRGLWQRGR